MKWIPTMVEARWRGYRLEVYEGHDGEWGCRIYFGHNMTPRAQGSKHYPTSLKAKRVAKKLVLKDRKTKTIRLHNGEPA